MSTQSKSVHSSSKIIQFYRERIESFGDTAKGVGWKNDEAQFVRFEQLIKIINKTDFSVNDLGCGSGKFLRYLFDSGLPPTYYFGYDILDEMIDEAKHHLRSFQNIELLKIINASEMKMADYSVASGIFNVRYEASNEDWMQHIISTLNAMNEASRLGFAFNMLTQYSDAEFMQDYLYYGDPSFYFNYCKLNYSKNVALLHDYGQFDFTILVRK